MAADENAVVEALRRAVRSDPDRAEFRTALAEALLAAGDAAGAIVELGEALRIDPRSGTARDLMLTALGAKRAGPGAGTGVPDDSDEAGGGSPDDAGPPAVSHPATDPDAPRDRTTGDAEDAFAAFDWAAAEADVADVAPPPRFVYRGDGGKRDGGSGFGADGRGSQEHDGLSGPDPDDPLNGLNSPLDPPTVTLDDVGGLRAVKERLEVAFLAPMRNPELRKLYGKSLRGGLLLYGPPGCGKTFVARAVAGELGASFLSVGIADVLDMYLGASERNLHQLFRAARRKAPCVLFFDEVDALGQRRSQLRNNALRTTVNQFLAELDSVDAGNDGVFVLGATNTPWDVDPALRRPGRFDRTILVLPPDAEARTHILESQLRDRPITEIDLPELVGRTAGFSGADLTHLCETAAERALLESVRSGTVRMIGMPDFEAALTEVRPSTGPWFDAARSVALFGNEGGAYDDLAEFFRDDRSL